MYRLNKLNHFTDYETVKKILENGMRFSKTFDGWEDRNDAELIELYNEHHPERKAAVLCFLNDDESIYHWVYFTNGHDSEDVCCMEFDKNRLLEIAKECGFECREVQYDTLKEVSFDDEYELLFTKRWPYRNEREFRIVRLYEEDDASEFFLPVKDALARITVSGKLTQEECERRTRELKENFRVSCDINHSTVFRNDKWIQCARRLYPNITAGDILLKGGSVIKPAQWHSGLHAIGVVFHVDESGEHGWAVHLDDQSVSISMVKDIDDEKKLPFLEQSEGIRRDGLRNTIIMRENGDPTQFPAAYRVDMGEGWYIPAIKQLYELSKNKSAVNDTMKIVGGNWINLGFGEDYWSSTQGINGFWFLFGSYYSCKGEMCRGCEKKKLRAVRDF